MGFVPFTDTGKLCVNFELNGVQISICLHFQKDSASDADYQALADETAGAMPTELPDGWTADMSATLATVYDLTAIDAGVFTSTDDFPVDGTVATDSVPNNCAMVHTFRTTTRGRSGRGRVYMPGLHDGQVVDGLITGGTAAGRLGQFVIWMDALELATGFTQVVASRRQDGMDLALGITYPITEYTTTSVVRSQRRRTKVI